MGMLFGSQNLFMWMAYIICLLKWVMSNLDLATQPKSIFQHLKANFLIFNQQSNSNRDNDVYTLVQVQTLQTAEYIAPNIA